MIIKHGRHVFGEIRKAKEREELEEEDYGPVNTH